MDKLFLDALRTIGENLDRIATTLEKIQSNAGSSREVDMTKLLADATEAIRKSNPAFDLAFGVMERQVTEVKNKGLTEGKD